MSQWGSAYTKRLEVPIAGKEAVVVDATILPHYDGPAFSPVAPDAKPDDFLVTNVASPDGSPLPLSAEQIREAVAWVRAHAG